MVRLHNKLSSKQRKDLIITFLAQLLSRVHTFAGHTFMTRNSNQTTRRSPLGDGDSWVWDYCKRSYQTLSLSCGLGCGHTRLIVWSQQLIPYTLLWYTSVVFFLPLSSPPSVQEHLPPLSMKGRANVVTIDLTFAAFVVHYLCRSVQSC